MLCVVAGIESLSEVPGFREREAVAELGGLANCTFVISEDGGDVLAG